ncbi:MAG TPA: hypothetical protein PKI20_08570 [Verrucomicrobiota bacterium]|jgi:hypothetical protein|nr:hypothetical protein [Verrucomicrobiota bacterium]HQL78202.1 hypothetical protein [Verrucomicrobiota bacterium]
MSQTFLSFEQQTLDAEQALADAKRAAKEAAAAARAAAKQKEEMEKSTRRLMREAAYRRKHPPGSAQCGINWYPAGSGWTHCHKCGQALVYTTDRNAPRRDCPGHRP